MTEEVGRSIPRASVDRAIAVAKAFSDNADLLSRDEMSARAGNRPGSGSANTRVIAARKFGLIQSVRGSGYALTTLGHQVIQPAVSVGDIELAIRQVPLFDRIFDEFGADIYIVPRSILEDRIAAADLTAERAAEVLAVLLRSLSYARGTTGPNAPLKKQPSKLFKKFVEPALTTPGGSVHSADEQVLPMGAGLAAPVFADHPLIAAVLAQAPRNGESWNADRRDTWLGLLKTAISFVYPNES